MDTVTQWYVMRGGKSDGPRSETQLLELLDSGQITRQTSVWHTGVDSWQPLEIALGLVKDSPPPLPGGSPHVDRAQIRARTSTGIKLDNVSDPSSSWECTPHPWRRYLARMLDTIVGGAVVWILVFILLAVLWPSDYQVLLHQLDSKGGQAMSNILTVVFATFPIALFVGLTRSSLGKLIFGIRVSNQNGQPIGLALALRREWQILAGGWGFGIPIVSLFTLIASYRKLTSEQATAWDSKLHLRVEQRPSGLTQWILNCVGVGLICGSIFALAWLANV